MKPKYYYACFEHIDNFTIKIPFEKESDAKECADSYFDDSAHIKTWVE